MSFKNAYSEDVRITESIKIKQKYPNRIPIICETELEAKKYKKYLVPMDLTMGNFMHVVRKRLKFPPERALFLFINDRIIPPSSSLISQIYNDHKDSDGFLYITASEENVFG